MTTGTAQHWPSKTSSSVADRGMWIGRIGCSRRTVHGTRSLHGITFKLQDSAPTTHTLSQQPVAPWAYPRTLCRGGPSRASRSQPRARRRLASLRRRRLGSASLPMRHALDRSPPAIITNFAGSTLFIHCAYTYPVAPLQYPQMRRQITAAAVRSTTQYLGSSRRVDVLFWLQFATVCIMQTPRESARSCVQTHGREKYVRVII